MKIVTYKYNKLEYPDWLCLQTEEDLGKYADLEEKFQANDFAYVLSTHLNTSRGDFCNTAQHYSKGMAMVSSFATFAQKEKASIIDIAQMQDKLVSQKICNMLDAISAGEYVFINRKGGYHSRFPEEIKIISQTDIDDEKLRRWVYRTDTYEYHVASWRATNIIYHKGKCYYNDESHLYLCDKYNIKEDECLKLIWNKKCKDMEFGIPHLKLSEVYQTVSPPIIPTKQDLDIIENTCKEIERKYNRR